MDIVVGLSVDSGDVASQAAQEVDLVRVDLQQQAARLLQPRPPGHRPGALPAADAGDFGRYGPPNGAALDEFAHLQERL